MNPDSPNKSGAKADLYSIIKRRKRNVRQYLKEHGVNNLKAFKQFVSELKKQFSVSEKFIEEGTELFKAVELNKKDVESTTETLQFSGKRPTTTKKRTVKKTTVEQDN